MDAEQTNGTTPLSDLVRTGTGPLRIEDWTKMIDKRRTEATFTFSGGFTVTVTCQTLGHERPSDLVRDLKHHIDQLAEQGIALDETLLW